MLNAASNRADGGPAAAEVDPCGDAGGVGRTALGWGKGISGSRGITSAALLSVLLLPACTDSASTPGSATSAGATPRRSASSPAESTPTGTAGQVAVENAYRAFWPVITTFQNSPESQWQTVLGRVAVDPQLSFAIATTRQQRRTGITVYGRTVPRAPKVTLAAGGKSATVRDCADFSRTGLANAETKKPRTVGVARTPISAVLLLGSDRRWRISRVTFLGGSC